MFYLHTALLPCENETSHFILLVFYDTLYRILSTASSVMCSFFSLCLTALHSLHSSARDVISIYITKSRDGNARNRVHIDVKSAFTGQIDK